MTTSPQSLAGKVALVTGGTRGIGLAIATQFARAGARVVVCSRKADAVAAVVEALRADGLRADGVPANVGRMEEARALVDQVASLCGGVDIVVNNAAVNPVFGPALETDEGAFDKIMAVNVKGPFEIAKRAYPLMVARGGGSIINISSIGGVSPEPYLGIYSMSKAALLSLTRVLAKEWGPQKVRVNAICPGLIQTDFSSALWKDEKLLKGVQRKQPLPQLAQPDDVAGMALFLASDASSFCTGGTYMVDGGYTI
ncbi:MAG: short-chain dehydrogenase [Gemmatimonadetes bacterium]|nr:short-chain dehydrogenase [Gemmatimonadota bacterium]